MYISGNTGNLSAMRNTLRVRLLRVLVAIMADIFSKNIFLYVLLYYRSDIMPQNSCHVENVFRPFTKKSRKTWSAMLQIQFICWQKAKKIVT